MSYKSPIRKPPHHAFVKEVDEFMAASKELFGALEIQAYQKAREDNAWEVDYPILIDGEIRGQSLRIVTHPHELPIVWSLVLIWPPAISRLDFTTREHPNPPQIKGECHPPSVDQPHIHPWKLNKRFMTSRKTTESIPIALPISHMKDFATYLRWFCDENNIMLPHNHCIQLLDKLELFE